MTGQKAVKDNRKAGENMRQQIKRVRELTDKPFGINIVSTPMPSGISNGLFDTYTKVLLEEKVPIALVVGVVDKKLFKTLKAHDIKIVFRPLDANPRSVKPADLCSFKR